MGRRSRQTKHRREVVLSQQNRSLVTVDSDQEQDWRPRVLLIGGVVGALLGLLSAYLFIRANDENEGPEAGPPRPGTGEAFKLGAALLTIIRTVAEWGAR